MTLGAVILAAGAGTRLGGVAKALLPCGERTFLARITATAAAAGIAPDAIVVVVGAPFAGPVAAHAAELGLATVENPAPTRGMASSVACGFAALPAAVDAAFLWPVDHPLVTPATLAALVARSAGVPTWGGRGGHPPLVPRAHFAALVAGDHPDGARGALRTLPRIAVDDPAVIRDVDVPADLPIDRAEAACAR